VQSTLTDAEKTKIIEDFISEYETRVQEECGHALDALYRHGSYAFGKVNLDFPDLNYLLVVKKGAHPNIFLRHGQILREMSNVIKEKAQVMVEFRPNRYIYPSKNDVGFEISIDPQYIHAEDGVGDVPFGWGWVLQGSLDTRKLVFGEDVLEKVVQPPLTTEYIIKYFPGCYSHIWLPLERAPVQYKMPDDYYLLLHEAYCVAKMSAIGWGVNLAMTEEEMESKAWLKYMFDKNELIPFYHERYDEKTAKNVEYMLNVRDHWMEYKHDTEVAIRMYQVAYQIVMALKVKYGQICHDFFSSGRTLK
jgi:hypothetical protein